MAELILSQKYDYEDYAKLANQSNKSLLGLFKDLDVKDTNGNTTAVFDSGEAKYIKDAEYGLGYFPTNAFELIDFVVHLPLKKYWAQSLIPIKTGGGAVEQVASFRANNAPVDMQLATGQGNSIPLVNGKREKYRIPVVAWEAGIFLGKVDLMFAQQGNYSILEHYEEALRDSYWYRIEQSAFMGNIGIKGITSSASTGFVGGLLNSIPTAQQITSQDYTKAVPTDLNFLEMDLPQLVAIFAKVVQSEKSAVRYDSTYYINRGILPPELFQNLAQPAVIGTTTTGSVYQSKMDYLVKELQKLNKGIAIEFEEVPYVGDPTLDHNKGYIINVPGANSLGQVVLYNQSEKSFHFPITLPLVMGEIMPSPTEGGYRKNGLTFMGEGIIVHRPQTIWAIVNKTTAS